MVYAFTIILPIILIMVVIINKINPSSIKLDICRGADASPNSFAMTLANVFAGSIIDFGIKFLFPMLI